MKICSTCNIPKPLTDFTKRNKGNQTHSYRCKACDKIWWEQHRERILVTRREHYHNNKETRVTRTRNNWERRLLKIAKRRARLNGIEFTLVVEDIIIPDKCPYLNITLTRTIGSGKLPTSATLDRIDNSKGYLSDNIQVISYLANTMKSNATKKQLTTFAKNILNIHPNK